MTLIHTLMHADLSVNPRVDQRGSAMSASHEGSTSSRVL